MLVQDTAAFIEQLEVERHDKPAAKERRRRAQAELEALRADCERRAAVELLRGAEAELAGLRDAPGSGAGRGLLRARKRRLLENRVQLLLARVRALEAETIAARERLRALERRGSAAKPRPGAKVFRLHSASHHVECSEQRFRRLAEEQADRPVLVGTTAGRRWWWFRDRFWWDEAGLRPDDVKLLVLEADLRTKHESEAMQEARAALFHEARTRSVPVEPASPIVRFAVWCRDRGRCVDCGTAEGVRYDVILPESPGGARLPANVELRCEACHARRAHNQERARVGRALVGAQTQVL